MRRDKSDSSKRPARPSRLGRILVVEDDPIVALALEAALMDVGATEVVVCPSIACTMEALEQGSAAAIVLDVHLADRSDGWALAELAELGPVFEKPYDPAQLAEALASGAQRGLFARLLG